MTKTRIQEWMSGDKLRGEKVRKWYPFLGMLVGMVFLYILAGYGAAKQQHKLTDVKKEMLDAKYKYMTISAELVKTTRQSYIADELKARGSQLRESTTAPVLIGN